MLMTGKGLIDLGVSIADAWENTDQAGCM